MPAATAPDVTGSEPAAYMLPGVNLFASGEYRGKPWPPAVLRLIARNCGRLGPKGKRLLVPPSVLGHEEDQDWLDRTDLPAAGWVDPDSVTVVPDPEHEGELILRGDVVNIPAVVKREKLDTGEYRYGSAEIYDDFKDDFGTSYGKALRRFALLGGEVPQVKRLGPLPAAVPMPAPKKFSERPGVTIKVKTVRRGDTIHTYAETTVMDRQAMLAAIKAALPNLSQATLDPMTDEQLADLVKSLPSAPAATPAGGGAAAPAPASGMFADLSREEMIAALVDMGQDQAELEAMPEDELGALYDEMTAADDAGTEGGESTEEMGDPAAMPREELIAELVAQGQDAAQLEAMSDDDLRALYGQLVGGATATAPAAAPAPVAAMGDRGKPKPKVTPKPRVSAMSESAKIAKKARQLNSALDGELRRLRVANHNRKVEDATRFCDKLVADGRATPALVKTALLGALLAADDTRAVHKHSENGQTRTLTAYELKKLEFAKLPRVVKFGERLPGGAKVEGSQELAKVRAFADAVVPEGHREQYVETFCELQKKKPRLTAKEYGAV